MVNHLKRGKALRFNAGPDLPCLPGQPVEPESRLRALRVRTKAIPHGRVMVTEVNLSYPLSKDWGATKSGRGKEMNTPPTSFCLSLPCGTREVPLRMPRAVGK